MLDGLAPDLAPRLLIAIGGVAVAFLVLIAVLLFLRRRNSPLFVKGGRAREHRLLVMDAAAVDAKRRLVLVRRDDTEHLIMIGGPTDIVIETGISGASRPRAVATAQAPARPIAAERPVQGEKPQAPQRPATAEKPAAERPAGSATVTALRPAELAQPGPSNHGQADNARRQRQGQNGDPAQNQRRLERQAARAAAADAAAKAGSGPQLAALSAAGSVPQGSERPAPAEAKPTPEAADDKSAAAREAGQRPNNVVAAAQAENTRERVMPPFASRSQPVSHEDAIRQLEEQLDAGKAEAARSEAAKAEAARLEAEKAEAARAETARIEAERAAAKAEAERVEAARAEAAKLEAARLQAQKAEAARLEAERAERMRQEAQRAEAERAEAARIEAENAEAERAEAARREAERVAAARAEAMARFEAARRAQAEQRLAAQTVTSQPVAHRQEPAVQQQPVVQPAQWPVEEREIIAEQQPAAEPQAAEPAEAKREPEMASLEQPGSTNQERLASDFEKLLEAELEADGVLDNYPAPNVAGERREGFGAPPVNPVRREGQPITGAAPGVSIEQDMARRLGEISLNKKTDAR